MSRTRRSSKVATASALPILETRSEAGITILRFGGRCTREEAAALRSGLLAALEARQPLLLDAGGIEVIDTAALQLLVALAIDCMERGTAFCWKARSAPAEEAIRQLGVAALLESPSGVEQFAALL